MSRNKWQVLQWAGRLVRFVSLSGLAGRFGYGFVAPIALDPEQGDQPLQRSVKLLQSFGFRSSPKVVGSEGLLLAPRAGASNGVAVAVDNLSIGPIDLKEGESVQYGVGGSTLKHDQAGKITVDSAAGQDVQVNGGTLKVARVTDGVSCGSLTFVAYPDPNISANLIFQITAITEEGATKVLGISIPAATFPVPPSPAEANPLIFPIVGKITGPGADRFKA